MRKNSLKILVAILVIVASVHVVLRGVLKSKCHQDILVYKCRISINYALTEGTPKSHKDDKADEFIHKIRWNETDVGELNFSTVREALSWVHENIVYCYDMFSYGCLEAWATPEATLTLKTVNDTEGFYGDCEDLAILLASLIKFHTFEFRSEEDEVYVRLGPIEIEPGMFILHAWVVWYDHSEQTWWQLDPTTGTIKWIQYPDAGTLWFNDEGVFGFLPGYYPELY